MGLAMDLFDSHDHSIKAKIRKRKGFGRTLTGMRLYTFRRFHLLFFLSFRIKLRTYLLSEKRHLSPPELLGLG